MGDSDNKRSRLSSVPIDEVINLVMPYITDPNDRASTSLVCRRWFDVDSETREHVTVPFCYAAEPQRLRRRFPNLRSLKLKGKPRAAMFNLIPVYWGGYATPWVKEIVNSFRCLKSVHFRRMIVTDLNLDRLANARKDELEVLKLDKCSGFSTDGLLSIAQNCTKLKTFFMEESIFNERDGDWLHEIALHNTSLEEFNIHTTQHLKIDPQELETIARNCPSLVSLKYSDGDIIELVGFFKAATNLQEFCGGSFNEDPDEPDKYLNLTLPPKLRSVGLPSVGENTMPVIFPVAAQLLKLDLLYANLGSKDHCTLIPKCPNLEVFKTRNVVGNKGLAVLARHCKRLKRLRIERGMSVRGVESSEGRVSQIGLITVAEGCKELEYLAVYASEVDVRSLKSIGKHLKNLRDFRLVLLEDPEERIEGLQLDEGVRALLRGCENLRRFAFYVSQGDISDTGMRYIGQYSQNVRWMLLGGVGQTDEGLLQLSNGCPSLKKLEMRGCCFNEGAIAEAVMRLKSLRYLWAQGYKESEEGEDLMAMARPYWNIELIRPIVKPEVNHEGELSGMEQPSQILSYYSLAGQRRDYPSAVIPFFSGPRS